MSNAVTQHGGPEIALDCPQPFDYLVIGGGSAGCVLAARLSEKPSARVCLLEAGPDMPPERMPESIASENYLPDYFSKERYWTGLTVFRSPVGNWSPGQIAEEMTPVRYEQARVMGGGSSVNGQVALRGIPSDYNEWERLGATGWGWRDFLPYFRKLERDLDFGGPPHGKDGPLPIRRTFPKDWGGFALAFREAAAQAGMPYHDDANAESGDGCFPFPRNNVYGMRVSTALAYRDDATRPRTNLRIIPKAVATHLECDGRRAVAVRALVEGRPVRLPVREIIVAAGAIHTPGLLMRSGIGPAEHLREHGIAVVADRPGVGAHLQDHPLVGLGAHLKPEGRLDPQLRNPFLVYARFSSGMAGCPMQDMKISLANRFDPSPVGQQFAVVRVGPDKAFSRGFVRLDPAKPEGEPFVVFNLLADERDLLRMRDGVRLAHRLLSTPQVQAVSHGAFAGAYTRWLRALRSAGPIGSGISALGARLLDGGDVPRRALMRLAFPAGSDLARMTADDRLLDDWIRATVLGNWHACGTCRMGAETDRGAVVDPLGRVIGVEGLRVADASIMPTVPCANTNLSPIMIAEKISDAARSHEADGIRRSDGAMMPGTARTRTPPRTGLPIAE